MTKGALPQRKLAKVELQECKAGWSRTKSEGLQAEDEKRFLIRIPADF